MKQYLRIRNQLVNFHGSGKIHFNKKSIWKQLEHQMFSSRGSVGAIPLKQLLFLSLSSNILYPGNREELA